MTTELLLPRGKILRPKPPSRIKLDMAFAIGAGVELHDKSRYRSRGAIITATWADGLHGKCLDFNPATPDYVTIPAAHTQLNFTTQDFSIIGRIYLDDDTIGRAIFWRSKFNRIDGYNFYITDGGRLSFWTCQGGVRQNTYSALGDIAVGTWYTVGMSRSGASIALYRNGVALAIAADVHIDPRTSSEPAYIGRDENLDYKYDGKIEFLRIFGGIALTASEHLAYHRALA